MKILLCVLSLAFLVGDASANGGLFSRARSRANVRVNVQNVRVKEVQQVKVQQVVQKVQQVQVKQVVQQQVVKQVVAPVYVAPVVSSYALAVQPAQAYFSYQAQSYAAPFSNPCSQTQLQLRQTQQQLQDLTQLMQQQALQLQQLRQSAVMPPTK